MDKKAEYFIEKIEETIKAGQFIEAQSYYNKACSIVGEIPEISVYKETIESGVKSITPTEKRKPISKNLVIASVVIVGIIGALIYYFTAIYPPNHLKNQLSSHRWYQGNFSGSPMMSDGISLEFKKQYDDTLEIEFRKASGMLITSFSCEIVNGHEITVDGYFVQVEFKGDTVIFTPSFTDTSEKSVWSSSKTSAASLSNVGISNDENSKNENSIANNANCDNGHTWVAITETVHHDEVGHYEEVVVNYESVEKYQCSFCDNGKWTDSYDEIAAHFKSVHDVTERDLIIHYCYTSYDQKPIYENQWIIDTEAYNETVTTGYKCSVCGQQK